MHGLLGLEDEFLYLRLRILLELLGPALDDLLRALAHLLGERVLLDDEFLLQVGDVFDRVRDLGDSDVALPHGLLIRVLGDGLQTIEVQYRLCHLRRNRLGEPLTDEMGLLLEALLWLLLKALLGLLRLLKLLSLLGLRLLLL